MTRTALQLTLCFATVLLPVAFAKYGDVWITGGGSSGRLEFKDQTGTWGTVCDIGFSQRVGKLACRQLGYKQLDKVIYDQYGSSSRLPVAVCEIYCNGGESHLSECQITTCDKVYAYQIVCTKEHIVGIQCTNSTIKEFISGKVDDSNDNAGEVIDNEGSGDDNFDDEDVRFDDNKVAHKFVQYPSTATPTTPEVIVDYSYGDFENDSEDDGLSGGAIAGLVVSCVVVFILLVIFVIFVIMLSYHRYQQRHTYIITHRNPTIMVASCSVTTPKPVSYAPSPTFGYTSYAKGYKKVPITDYTPVSSTIGNSAK